MSDLPSTLKLAFNPFEPAASGPPVGGVPFGPPSPLEARIRRVVDQLVDTRGTRAVVIIGDYGSGKTCLLRWLQNHLLPEHRIQPFCFDNPGVHFYNLANTLLRAIGRKDFAKFIWELAGTHVQARAGPLSGQPLPQRLRGVPRRRESLAAREPVGRRPGTPASHSRRRHHDR